MLTDNKKRSVGKKRQALVELATKDYVAFIDDDDCPMPSYIKEVYEAIQEGFDAVLFDSSCKMNDDPAVHVEHGMGFPDEEYNPKGFRRNLWHIHAIRSDIAKAHEWPDTSYGEDIGWLRSVRKDIIWTYKIDKTLYCYQFDSEGSETQ